MPRERKCILCETVLVSNQEMEEHMRSMLHHRELEKLKGRDCGHQCRVCKVTVVSLTDYASHISSPTHKQKVEAAEQKLPLNDYNVDYFDKELVELIEKRKEQIRKEKEAAAAKLAAEEAERKRKEEFQQRLNEAKVRYQLESSWKQPPQGFRGSSQQGPWYRGNGYYNNRPGEERFWNHRQGRSATWHAQGPPNLQNWPSGGFSGGSLNCQEGWERKQWHQGMFPGNQQRCLPWLSSGGSSNGVYGRNNISQYTQHSRPWSHSGPPIKPPPASFLAQPPNQTQNAKNCQGGQQGVRVQNGEGQSAETDPNSGKSSKPLGLNPKLDKAFRWSPYPVTKGSESAPHKDNPSLIEKCSKVPATRMEEKTVESSATNGKSQSEAEPEKSFSGQNVDVQGRDKRNHKATPKDASSSSSSSSSSTQTDVKSLSASSNESKPKPKLNKNCKRPSVSGGTQLSSSSCQAPAQARPNPSQSDLPGSKVPPQSRPERQPPENSSKARQTVPAKTGSLDSTISMESQQSSCVHNQIAANKENSCRQDPARGNLPDSVSSESPASADCSQFLQSLQVSTSTVENSVATSRQDEAKRKTVATETCSVARDDVTQCVEAGHSSESDASRSGEAQAGSGSNRSSLSKLDLPPVLKRDLTKHMSSKNKTGSHEPNLNIARRVRNLSGSRRSDSEKDSGLKPTVRQLISSSGSRRNVNWEQVYQEVRKKQDKVKGLPRFGIEMVPCDQDDQSQEEDDIPLLEGFQWESLMDISAQGSSRKRSLSESSIAPAAVQHRACNFAPREALGADQLGSSVSPVSAQGSKDDSCLQQAELRQLEAEAEKQPSKQVSAAAKDLQRSDLILLDSSSGTEQCDGQGTGKRRRAAAEVLSAETSCLERNNKRRKVKSKKERQQIDHLLAVSLREEELSRSLQNVDANLITARATLEAAYMEVQRLMVVKQQVTAEMNTLRSKRIELLKGMQGSLGDVPQMKLKEETIDLVDPDPPVPSTAPSSSVSAAEAAAAASPRSPAHRASPPSSSLPVLPIAIKQEPRSPVHVSSEVDLGDNSSCFAHSVTTTVPAAVASSAEPAHTFHPVPERKPELHHTKEEHVWENFEKPSDFKETLSERVEATDTSARNCITPDSKPPLKLPSPSRRSSEVGSVVDSAATQSFEAPSVPPTFNLPGSPSELRSGKRVRKLKKRKVLKKAQGTEQPESSDTELDGENARPKWLRPRRRPSGGSQVSTSTLPTEDKEDMNVESWEAQMLPITQPETAELNPSEHMEELPQAAFSELMLNIQSVESMEVSTGQQPVVQTPPSSRVPDSSRPQPQSLACNEVTSTSDMDICKSSENEMPFPVTLPRITKTSSDAASDHGEDEMPTEGMFEGHHEAVNAMQIHNGLLYTCSGDRTVRAFDLVSHKCVSVYEGHCSKVSCLLVSAAPSLYHRLYTGSSDQIIRCYSLKTQELEEQFFLSDRVLCFHSRWKTLYAGLANGSVLTFNLKTNKQMGVFECHGPRAVSCLASSQEGARRILLVGSYDSTISVRDAKSGLLLRTLEGHSKTILCIKVVNDLVFSGSSDQCVYAHNIHTGELVRVYKGHSHAVTDVSVLGKVMVTACLDKLVRVYDLQSHEQLQVYGGHKDMVMCLAVHKNLIYTGCYDGSVQAVKLNLMQSNRCWWHGCSLLFGVREHLHQHLITDHTSPSLKVLKCRWKNCEEFFCARNSSKQGMLVHMQKHTEEETHPEP